MEKTTAQVRFLLSSTPGEVAVVETAAAGELVDADERGGVIACIPASNTVGR